MLFANKFWKIQRNKMVGRGKLTKPRCIILPLRSVVDTVDILSHFLPIFLLTFFFFLTEFRSGCHANVLLPFYSILFLIISPCY